MVRKSQLSINMIQGITSNNRYLPHQKWKLGQKDSNNKQLMLETIVPTSHDSDYDEQYVG